MLRGISRFFVHDGEDPGDPRVRAACGVKVGVIGILTNLVLFTGKFIVGAAVGSLAISADAFNNLSDAGSSGISLVSFRIAAKPADRDHPFGHARIEYIASMIVSFLILLVGFELASQSVRKIISPDHSLVFSVASVVVCAFSILAKLSLALLNRRIGRKIGSEVMLAAATDSISDVLSTSAVLVSTVILRLTGFDIDAYVGLAVALLIFIAGIKILNGTKNSLLGEAPVAAVTDSIRSLVAAYPAVLGIHDLMVHSYGPGHTFASLHAEVDGRENVFDSHDMIDEIERRIRDELQIACTIHMDPIVVDDEITTELRQKTAELASEIDPRIHIHDFRLVRGPTHCNLIFDMEVPYEIKLKNNEVSNAMAAKIKSLDPTFYTVVTVDRG